MFERQIPIEPGERLTLVELAGAATVITWDEDDVRVRMRDGEEEHLTVEQTKTGPAVTIRVPCELCVPARTPVTIRQVKADLKVSRLDELNAEQVRGNLRLRDVNDAVIAEVYGNLKADATKSVRLVGTVYGNATLKGVGTSDLQNVRGNLLIRASNRMRASRIGGNLQAKAIEGTLDIDKVGGNVLLKGVAGPVTLDQVAGNLTAKDVGGGAKVARIGGNLALNGRVGAGCTYHFRADGNAVLRLPEGAGAHMTLRAKGRLRSTVALADEEKEENVLRGSLGGGGAEVVVEAGGNVLLEGPGSAVGAEVSEEISRQVEESLGAVDLGAIGEQVSAEMEQALSRLRIKLESVDWNRVGHRAERAVERAMERMQRDAERLAEQTTRQQERLEHVAAREARRLERMERTLHRSARSQRHGERVDVEDRQGGEDVEAMAPEPRMDEERLSILRMVELGQITPKDAEMLLDALE